MDEFAHSESVVIDASPETVYDLVTDIGRTGEWSPICRECWWRDDGGPTPGAWFEGRNEADGRVWETESQVAVADRPYEFTWLVAGKYARWGFRCDEEPGDVDRPARTRLTESWEFLPAGREFFGSKYGAEAQKQVDLRRRQAREGIPVTLAAIKRIAEG